MSIILPILEKLGLRRNPEKNLPYKFQKQLALTRQKDKWISSIFGEHNGSRIYIENDVWYRHYWCLSDYSYDDEMGDMIREANTTRLRKATTEEIATYNAFEYIIDLYWGKL